MEDNIGMGRPRTIKSVKMLNPALKSHRKVLLMHFPLAPSIQNIETGTQVKMPVKSVCSP